MLRAMGFPAFQSNLELVWGPPILSFRLEVQPAGSKHSEPLGPFVPLPSLPADTGFKIGGVSAGFAWDAGLHP